MNCNATTDLQFDHKDPSKKKYEISKHISAKEIPDFVWNEIKVCQLLCKTCHKEKSDEESGVGHGQGKKGKRGCKCGPCKIRLAEYNKAYKAGIRS